MVTLTRGVKFSFQFYFQLLEEENATRRSKVVGSVYCVQCTTSTTLTRNLDAKNANGQMTDIWCVLLQPPLSGFKQRKGMPWNPECVKFWFLQEISSRQDFTTSTPNPEEMLDGTATYPGPGQRNKSTDARVGYLYKLPPSGETKHWVFPANYSNEKIDLNQVDMLNDELNRFPICNWFKITFFSPSSGRALPQPPHVPPPDYNEAITGRWIS